MFMDTRAQTKKAPWSSCRFQRFWLRVTTSALALVIAQLAQADEWTGVTDDDWFNSANWSFFVVPTSSSPRLVIIDAGSSNPARIGGAGIDNAEATTMDIGVNRNGVLEIEGGSRRLFSGDATLGRFWGSRGEVGVTGPDAQWGILGNLVIGNEGSGRITLENGATLGVSGNVDLARFRLAGFGQASEGALIINSGSLVQDPDTGTFGIGISGDATLEISNGGQLVSGYTTLGLNADGTAEASIYSNDATRLSRWQANNLRVGGAGQAGLAIGQGAVVHVAGDALIGDEAGSRGTVLVFREASSAVDAGILNIGGALAVGEGGHASLLIGNGGKVDVAGVVVIADNASASGSLVVGSAGELYTHHDGITVGALGEGELTLSEGGRALLHGGVVTLGFFAGSSGTLNIGAADGSEARAPGVLDASNLSFGAGAGTLVFNHTGDDYVFSSNISGNGLIEHRAGGTTLTGDGSAFTGGVFLEGGRLRVNGLLGGGIDVSGGTLVGTGQVGNVFLRRGGQIAPGNSIGTLTVAGDITIAPGSDYEAEVNAAGASDLIHATGTATINGGSINVLPSPDFAVGSAYTLLTADGGLVGAGFDAVNFDSLFVSPVLSDDANHVYLTITQTTDFAAVARTPNQVAAAGGIQSVASGSLFGAIASLGDADEALRAFDGISGEVHASIKTALIEDSRFVRSATLSRPIGEEEDGGLWTKGFGSWGRWDSDGNAGELSRHLGGLLFGRDGLALEDIQLGWVAGYARSSLYIDERASTSTADSYTLGAYVGRRWDALSLKGGVAHSWHQLGTARTVAFSGFTDSLSSNYSARTLQTYGQAAYSLVIDGARIEPFTNLTYVHLNTDGYSEIGGAAALTAASQSIAETFTTIGLRGKSQFDFGGAPTHISGSAGWRHAFGNTPTATHHFSGADNFTVTGVPIAVDALALDLGVSVNLTQDATIGLSYHGQFGSSLIDQGLRASLNVAF